MEGTTSVPLRRKDTTAVHSLHRFVFSVPDLDEAVAFYDAFGLDVREATAGSTCTRSAIRIAGRRSISAQGAKQLEYVSFGVYAEDSTRCGERLRAARRRDDCAARAGRRARACGLRDPEGIAGADRRRAQGVAVGEERCQRGGRRTGPRRGADALGRRHVRPRRLSHILLFSSDVQRSVRFYSDALGLRLSDHSGDIIAFLHGAHASDHHMLAFAKSDGPGIASFELGRREHRRRRPRHAADGRPRAIRMAGAWAAT